MGTVYRGQTTAQGRTQKVYNENMSDAILRRMHREALANPTPENLANFGLAYLRYGVPPKYVLRLVGRRWLQKSAGNTYHAVDVYLDDELIGKSGVVYGYGDCYVQTGMEIAARHPFFQALPVPSMPLRLWAEEMGIKLENSVVDVSRRSSL